MKPPLSIALALAATLAPQVSWNLPMQSAVQSGGQLWAIETGNESRPNGSLIRFEIATGNVLEQRDIQGPGSERLPNDFVFDTSGTRIYAAQLHTPSNTNTKTILQTIDFATATVISSVTIDGWLDGLARHPITGKLWGTYLTPQGSQRKLVRVNPVTGAIKILGSLPADLFPRGLAFSPDGRQLWALVGPNQPSPECLLRVNPNNGEVLASLPWTLPDSPLAIEILPSGQVLAYAYDGKLYSLSTATGAATLISVLGEPIQHIITGLELPPPVPAGG